MTTCSHSAGRPHSSIEQVGERDRRLSGVWTGRLEHDRAAGRDRRRELVGDEVEREVERADRADDADRHAQREAELALAAAASRRAATISPASVRASAAANVNVPTARCASTRAVLIGLAASSAMMRANSSRRSASRRAAVSRISARFQRGSGPAAGPPWRRATARSTSAAVHSRDAADLGAVEGRRHDGRFGAGEALAGERKRADHLLAHGRPYCAPWRALHGPRHPFLDWPGPIAFAHRGGAARRRRTRCRRSSGPSTLGYRYLETDVHVTADGVVVAFHDDDLSPHVRAARPDLRAAVARGRNGPGRRARSRSRRLDELLDAWPDARVNIDCKSDEVDHPAGDEWRDPRAVRGCASTRSSKTNRNQ